MERLPCIDTRVTSVFASSRDDGLTLASHQDVVGLQAHIQHHARLKVVQMCSVIDHKVTSLLLSYFNIGC